MNSLHSPFLVNYLGILPSSSHRAGGGGGAEICCKTKKNNEIANKGQNVFLTMRSYVFFSKSVTSVFARKYTEKDAVEIKFQCFSE
jgi:hypothetical protein